MPTPVSIASGSRSVQCYHCLKRFDVPPRAISLSCPWCSKRVTLEDLVVKNTSWSSRVQTCGRVVVHRKGSLVATLIEAREGIEVQEHVEGNLVSGGPVLIGPRARVKGDMSAPSIWVEPGATIEGGYFQIIGPDRLARGPSRTPRPPETGERAEVVTRPISVLPKWVPVIKPC